MQSALPRSTRVVQPHVCRSAHRSSRKATIRGDSLETSSPEGSARQLPYTSWDNIIFTVATCPPVTAARSASCPPTKEAALRTREGEGLVGVYERCFPE
jgi:hypothetical protein